MSAYFSPFSFSNIPITTATPEQCEELIARHFPPLTDNKRRLIGITFGTLHRQWQPEAAMELLKSTAARQNREPVVLALGRVGPHGAAILERVPAIRGQIVDDRPSSPSPLR